MSAELTRVAGEWPDETIARRADAHQRARIFHTSSRLADRAASGEGGTEYRGSVYMLAAARQEAIGNGTLRERPKGRRTEFWTLIPAAY